MVNEVVFDNNPHGAIVQHDAAPVARDVVDEVVASHGAWLDAEEIQDSVGSQRTVSDVVAVVVLDDVVAGVAWRHIQPCPTDGDGPLTSAGDFVVRHQVAAALPDPDGGGAKVDFRTIMDAVVRDCRAARLLGVVIGWIWPADPYGAGA